MLFDCSLLEDLTVLKNLLEPKSIKVEHVALHALDLDQSIKIFEANGYTIIRKTKDVAFLRNEKSGNVIELIPNNWDEHTAYVVIGERQLLKIQDLLEEKLNTKFEEVKVDFACKEVKHILYKHKETGRIIQFIWRQEPLI